MDSAEPVQQATSAFFVPVALAYLLACGGWLAMTWWKPALWPSPKVLTTHRRVLDFVLVFVVAAGVLVIGQLYSAGYLLPMPGDGVVSKIMWNLNNVIIFSPLFIALVWRNQSLRTIYLSADGLPAKIAYGFAAGVAAVLLFLAMRGELGRLPEVFGIAVSLDGLGNAFPVFMEGAILAYAFVRLRWLVGLVPALAIPAILFGLGHVPGSLEAGRSFGYIAAFFVFNSALTAVILYTVQRSQDIIWIFIVHYLMDCAIDAF